MKKKKWLIGLLTVVLILVAVCIIYINDYYRADEVAFLCISQPAAGITVETDQEGNIIFAPESPKAGLIFYPGGKVEAEAYGPLMEALAEQGVLSVLVQMPANLAVLDVSAADSIKAAFNEVEDWYMAGHSLGGSMAASYLGDYADDFKGLILLASYSTEDLAETELDVLSIYGDKDGVLDMTKYEENKVNLPSDYEEVIIKGGCHAYFGAYGEQEGDGEAAITREEQIEETVEAIAEFMK